MKRFVSLIMVFAMLLAPCAIGTMNLAFAMNDTKAAGTGLQALSQVATPHSDRSDHSHRSNHPGHSHDNTEKCVSHCESWNVAPSAVAPQPQVYQAVPDNIDAGPALQVSPSDLVNSDGARFVFADQGVGWRHRAIAPVYALTARYRI